MAVGGLLIAIIGSYLITSISPTLLLLVSAFAWIGAPLLLALADPAKGYTAFPLSSMICATLGIDLTFTISVVYLSAVQPAQYQGLAGAICSILVNLAIAFGLSFAQLLEASVIGHPDGIEVGGGPMQEIMRKDRAAFWFAVASAGVGLVIVAVWVRIPRSVVGEQEANKGLGLTDVDDNVEMAEVVMDADTMIGPTLAPAPTPASASLHTVV